MIAIAVTVLGLVPMCCEVSFPLPIWRMMSVGLLAGTCTLAGWWSRWLLGGKRTGDAGVGRVLLWLAVPLAAAGGCVVARLPADVAGLYFAAAFARVMAPPRDRWWPQGLREWAAFVTLVVLLLGWCFAVLIY